MTRRTRNLMLQFVLATAVCVLIGLFDRPLIGLAGFGVCTVIFTVSFLSRHPADDPKVASPSQTPVATAEDHVIYAQAPHCYRPGGPIYYPPEGEREPHGT